MSVQTSNVKTLVNLLNDKDFVALTQYRQVLKMSFLAVRKDYVQRRLRILTKENAMLLKKLQDEIDVIIFRQDLNNL